MILLIVLLIVSVIAIGASVHGLVVDGYRRMPQRPPGTTEESLARYR